MKRICKNVDITEWQTIYPWVMQCLRRHKKRYDFRHLMIRTGGITPEEYRQVMDGEAEPLRKAAENIAREAADRIQKRDLRLPPVQLREKRDHSTLKLRLIGRESAMQQIYDYIATEATNDIWKRRIVPQQSSSIAGRGPVYGARMISRWMNADQRAVNWARKHGRRYTRRCRYFVKLDIHQCYQSMRIPVFEERFRRDCGNPDILWLWMKLLESHHVEKPDGSMYEGFMIGALTSQQACQYILSFIYRYAMGLHKERRGRQVKLVTHATMFMDDMLLISGSRKNLKRAAKAVIRYAEEEMGLSIKPTWQICDVAVTPVDMMGYRINGDGTVNVRPRVFLRARRLALRAMRNGSISLRQAKRASSYKGYFTQKNGLLMLRSKRPYKKLYLYGLFRAAGRIISRHEGRLNNENRVKRGTAENLVYASA